MERLSTWQERISSLGKNDKRKGSQKLSLKKMRDLEGRRTKSQLFKDTPEWKVSKRLLRKKHQKEKIMRNKESKWGESMLLAQH